jgi:hypothetical protein
MADPKQVLQAKKAQILADAQKQAAEIDQDLAELERLTAIAAKHGLQFVATDANQVALVINKKSGARPNPDSAQGRARTTAEQVLREVGTPMRLKPLYEQIAARGATLGGKNPHWVLSAILCRDTTFMSPERGFWWLKALPVPPRTKQVDLLNAVANNGAGASH